MTDQEIEVALAGMPECKKLILMSEHRRELLYGNYQEWPVAVAQKTGSLSVDFNVHSRQEGGAWGCYDIEKAAELAEQSSREPVMAIAYSPFLDKASPLDPATVGLGPLGRFAVLGDYLRDATDYKKITILDSERFVVDRLGKEKQYVADDTTHNARIDTIHNACYDVASTWGLVDWYAGGRTIKTMTWRERRRNVDAEAFRVFEPDYWHDMVEASFTKMAAEDRLTLVTCHVSCGAGYVVVDGVATWFANLDYDPQITFDACKYLTDLGVQIILHPHPFNTSDGDTSGPTGIHHLRACIEGVNESVGG